MVHGREELSAAFRKPSWSRFVVARAQPRPRKPLSQALREQAMLAVEGWSCYFRQPIVPSSMAFVLLFFNVVMSPGGLITALLTSWGMDGTATAVFRGGCASECPGWAGRL